tara:strand:- start:289 stop:513 length:225 start_codon:yes stop_codon:yes gene_type:complete
MIILFLTLFAHADEPTIVYKEKTEIDFEAVDIEGQLKKPQGTLIAERKNIIFNPLINIREEWNQEMINSLDQVK